MPTTAERPVVGLDWTLGMYVPCMQRVRRHCSAATGPPSLPLSLRLAVGWMVDVKDSVVVADINAATAAVGDSE